MFHNLECELLCEGKPLVCAVFHLVTDHSKTHVLL